MTRKSDTSARHLYAVEDTPSDAIVPISRTSPRQTPEATPTTPALVHHRRQQPRWRWVRTFWAVVITVCAQLAIETFTVVTGNLLVGRVAMVAITVCGLLLIIAEAMADYAVAVTDPDPDLDPGNYADELDPLGGGS